MKRLRRSLILIIGVALLILGVRNTNDLLLRFAPKVILRKSLPAAMEQLQDRFSDSPLMILRDTLEKDGKYTAEGFLNLNNKLLGDVRVDGALETNARAHQLWIQGDMASSAKDLDMSFYMDPYCLVASSESLVGDTNYGITFDTFASDIRNIPLLNVFISEGVLSRWETSLQKLQEFFCKDWPILYLPELSEEEEQNLMLGLLMLPCESENRTVSVSDAPLQCRSLTYLIEGENLKVLPLEWPEELKAVDLSFYLNERELILLQCRLDLGQDYREWSLFLGKNPSQDPLILKVSGMDSILLTVTVTDSPNGQQCWEIQEKGKNASVFWNREQGTLTFGKDETEKQSLIFLQKAEEGFYLKTESLTQIWQRAGFSEVSWQPTACDLFIRKGSDIQMPEYKNIDSWSLEDFLLLSEGVDTWFGLHFDRSDTDCS